MQEQSRNKKGCHCHPGCGVSYVNYQKVKALIRLREYYLYVCYIHQYQNHETHNFIACNFSEL